MENWRLLDTKYLSAAENVALDEVLLEQKNSKDVPNTIRFLCFNPPAVLVGYHQSINQEVRVEYCKENGIDGKVIRGTGRVVCQLHKGGESSVNHRRS